MSLWQMVSRRELIGKGRVVLSLHSTSIPLNQKTWLMWMAIPGSHSQQCPHMKESGFCFYVQLCLCSSAFTQSSTTGLVCLQLWECFQTTEYLSIEFPKPIWTINVHRLNDPCHADTFEAGSPLNFLPGTVSSQICLKFLSWERRGRGEVQELFPSAELLQWMLGKTWGGFYTGI